MCPFQLFKRIKGIGAENLMTTVVKPIARRSSVPGPTFPRLDRGILELFLLNESYNILSTYNCEEGRSPDVAIHIYHKEMDCHAPCRGSQ
jgi:hypothetical protein